MWFLLPTHMSLKDVQAGRKNHSVGWVVQIIWLIWPTCWPTCCSWGVEQIFNKRKLYYKMLFYILRDTVKKWRCSDSFRKHKQFKYWQKQAHCTTKNLWHHQTAYFLLHQCNVTSGPIMSWMCSGKLTPKYLYRFLKWSNITKISKSTLKPGHNMAASSAEDNHALINLFPKDHGCSPVATIVLQSE